MIAVAAAYLVALQALILPLSLPAAAAAYAGGLCVTTLDGSAPPPAGQDHGCPCAASCGMQCHAPALGAGAAASLPAPRPLLVAVLAPAPLTPVQAPPGHGVPMPRGPPRA